jgi:beta-glucanase (GH16 family)
VWRPSAGLAGGARERETFAPRHTASPQLYRVRRQGIVRATIPVGRPGTYAVVVLMAEDGDAQVGSPLFDVVAGGATAGTFRARTTNAGLPNHVVFTTRVTGRRLTLRFRARTTRPQVSAIQVTRMPASAARAGLRWHDEFSGTAGTPADARRWTYDLGVGGTPGWGNEELQTYTDRPQNVALDGAGHLAITARREQLAFSDGAARDYTAARINTHGRFAFTYGDVEVRARLPRGPGIWPSLWMVGDDVYRVGWPRSGEIDIAELLHSNPLLIWGSLHGPAPKGGPYAVSRQAAVSRPLSDGFHTYGTRWVPGAIQMTLDSVPYTTYTPEDLGPARPWAFDHPFHLIMNVAVGGRTAGTLTAATPFPTTMLVDWVRVLR